MKTKNRTRLGPFFWQSESDIPGTSSFPHPNAFGNQGFRKTRDKPRRPSLISRSSGGHTGSGPTNTACMVGTRGVGAATAMFSAGRVGSDPAMCDSELAAATGGDPAARWRALEACRDYLRLVVRRGRWSSHSGRSATSDLVQKTIVDGWDHFSRFQGRTPGQFRAWLKAILIHASLNSRRRPRAIPIGSGTVGAATGKTTSPSRAAQKNAAREALDAALGRLSERHRLVIRLRVWEQLSFAEIGAKLEASEDAARMLYGRALARLRAAMRPGHDPG
jgi:RNA polymerase sigma-70 factor (ECF subfamily)